MLFIYFDMFCWSSALFFPIIHPTNCWTLALLMSVHVDHANPTRFWSLDFYLHCPRTWKNSHRHTVLWYVALHNSMLASLHSCFSPFLLFVPFSASLICLFSVLPCIFSLMIVGADIVREPVFLWPKQKHVKINEQHYLHVVWHKRTRQSK